MLHHASMEASGRRGTLTFTESSDLDGMTIGMELAPVAISPNRYPVVRQIDRMHNIVTVIFSTLSRADLGL
jgi:hypothetical protein